MAENRSEDPMARGREGVDAYVLFMCYYVPHVMDFDELICGLVPSSV